MKTIIDYIDKIENKKIYTKILKYFKNNWEGSNFIDFDSIGDLKIKHRTNNQLELFHRLLNETIESKQPKISFLIEKLKLIIVNKYNECIIADNKFINDDKYEKYSIFKDIFKFTVDFSKRYNKIFDFNFIIQDNENSLNNIKLICDRVIEQLFDIFINDNDKDDSSIKEQESENNSSFENDDLLGNKDDKEDVDIINENEENLKKEKNEVFSIDVKYEKKRKVPTFTYLDSIYDFKKSKHKNHS